MLKRRFIGVVTVRDGWAVQSFGYDKHLPLGRPEVLIENLDRWGADEIFVTCIDRSRTARGPDYALLERIGKMGLSTPLIYAGGLRTADDAANAVKLAADRVAFDALLRDNMDEMLEASQLLGAQALIAVLTLRMVGKSVCWHDYRTGRNEPVAPELLNALANGVISEAIVVDCVNEGGIRAFNPALLDFGQPDDVPLIAFGGISHPDTASLLFADRRVAAVAIGNALNYSEHALQYFKETTHGVSARPPYYQVRNWFA